MSQIQSQPVASVKNKASFIQIGKAVLWSLLGVRQQKGYEDDTSKITLKQAVVAGIIGGIIFVLSMLTFVRFVISQLGQ
ncbi:MAG TPA: DUF2970 domain-containing protein [Methylotenera sp.]|nr:DUF2970 domain-containing protein [Methylotenera sp.]